LKALKKFQHNITKQNKISFFKLFKDPGSDLKILCMVESLRYLSTMGFFSVIVATVTSHKSLSVSCFVQIRVNQFGGLKEI
jgi:hypothetical protein